MKFQGYDWAELLQLESKASCWVDLKLRDLPPVPPGTQDESYVDAECLKTYLGHISWGDTPKKIKERTRVCKEIRKFLVLLAKNDKPSKSIYLGMVKVKDDTIFLQWICQTLEFLWV